MSFSSCLLPSCFLQVPPFLLPLPYLIILPLPSYPFFPCCFISCLFFPFYPSSLLPPSLSSFRISFSSFYSPFPFISFSSLLPFLLVSSHCLHLLFIFLVCLLFVSCYPLFILPSLHILSYSISHGPPYLPFTFPSFPSLFSYRILIILLLHWHRLIFFLPHYLPAHLSFIFHLYLITCIPYLTCVP